MVLYKFHLDINTESLILNIKQLPQTIQNKLFIICMKEFWKQYVPLTAKVPSWYYHSIKIKQELVNARFQNIHFMHLPFNTLPENKQWIPGCQCDHCYLFNLSAADSITTDSTSDNKIIETSIFHMEMYNTYISIIPFTNSTWNDYLYRLGDTFIKVFDPFVSI